MDEFVAAGQRVSLGVVETDRTAPLPPGDPCVASDVALARSRRDWLRAMWHLAASSAVIGAASQCRATAAEDPRELRRSPRVLVLGAGMAGMAAAHRLVHEYGYRQPGRVIVVEARGRLGGRIATDRRWGVPLELGAQWIHESEGNPLTRLATRFGLRSIVTNYDSVDLRDETGQEVADARYNLVQTHFDRLLSRIPTVQNELDRDQSLAATFRQLNAGAGLGAADRMLLSWLQFNELELDYAARTSQLSTAAYDEDEEFDGDDWILTGGYDQLVTRLGQAIETRYRMTVESIQVRNDGSVRLRTGDEELSADACVVTLPLGVLKSKTLQFSPALPASLQGAVNRLGMGLYNKVLLEFPRRFWPADAQFLSLVDSDPAANVNFSVAWWIPGRFILVAGAVADLASRFEKMTLNEVRDWLLVKLRTLYGTQQVPAPVRVMKTEWSIDPFAGGSYSYWATGSGPADNNEFTKPVHQRLFFAGEHTSAQYPQTVHGAFLSGRRAAEQVVKLLGR